MYILLKNIKMFSKKIIYKSSNFNQYFTEYYIILYFTEYSTFRILLFQQSLVVIYQQKTKLSNSAFGTLNIVQFPSFTLFMRLRKLIF